MKISGLCAGGPRRLPAMLVCLLWCACSAWGGRFFDDAEKQTLLTSLTRAENGLERHGWTFYWDADPARPPAKGIPTQTGWYKLAKQGTTDYWEDRNGNRSKDEGETRSVPYWLYLQFELKERVIRSDWHRFKPEIALQEVLAGQPDAHRVSGLLDDEPLVQFGRACYAAGPCIELFATTGVFIVVDIGNPFCFGARWGTWLKANRKDPELTISRFIRPEPVDEEIRTLLAGACSKASRDAALKMLRAWTQRIAARVAHGPGFKGFHEPDMAPYLPKPHEMPGQWLVRTTEGWGKGWDFLTPDGGMRGAIQFKVPTTLSDTEDEPVQIAMREFATIARDAEPLTVRGADEACRAKGNNRVDWLVRKGNVLARIDVSRPGNAKSTAKAEAFARTLAELVLAKLANQPIPRPPPKPPAKHGLEARLQGKPEQWIGSGGMIAIQLFDADGDPVANEPVTLLCSDPEIGRPERTLAYTDDSGACSVRYIFEKAGQNFLLVESSAGRTKLPVTTGGFQFSLVTPEGSDGSTLIIRARAVDAEGFKPLRGLPVSGWINDSSLPERGRMLPVAPDAKTNENGEVLFTYLPPAAREGSEEGVIEVRAAVDAVGCPLRFSTSERLLIRLPKEHKRKETP